MTPQAPLSRATFAADMNITDHGLLDRLDVYLAHLRKWQRAINLVGPKTLSDPWRRHILDSAQLVSCLPKHGPIKIADLGSGAGLPGLILAIMTGADVHMIESDQRKATFIREGARLTETDVTVHVQRIEDAPPLNADVVTARALAPMDRLLPWVYRHLKNGGKSLLLKGAEAEEELTLTAKQWTMKTSRKRSLSDGSGTVLIIDDLAPVTDV